MESNFNNNSNSNFQGEGQQDQFNQDNQIQQQQQQQMSNVDIAQDGQVFDEVHVNNQGDFQERQGSELNQLPHASMATRNMIHVQQPTMAAGQMNGIGSNVEVMGAAQMNNEEENNVINVAQQNNLNQDNEGMASNQQINNGQDVDDDDSDNSQNNLLGDDEKPIIGQDMAKMLTPFVQGINKTPSYNPNCNFDSHV